MSLFASLGQGDIWALSGISFASPINDLLEKGVFTLENLLEEDELIQEVKAKNELLIEFLSREETINHLLDFIILPVDSAEGELRTFKYPYMSCEVICCESPEILNSLVEKGDGKFLNKLFTFLSGEKRLDYYLAGYFEKILEMLFRRMTVPMMKYFNDAGTSLLVKFLNHMDNYSIMQIVQRLMLPHIPFSNLNDNDSDLSDEERLLRQCNWSYSVEACQLLLDRMLEYRDADVPLHISDLLITVLQLSPPETLVISFLCEPACAERLVRAVVGVRSAPDTAASGGDDERDLDQADIALPGESYTSSASVSLAAISVLESLNSRLFEASLPFDQSMSQTMESNNQDHLFVVREQIDTICNELLPYIPQLQEILQRYLTNNPCKTFLNQSKCQTNRLGHRGLQLVKLVESIVRMSNAAVDDAFCQTGLFKTCIGLFFRFENNSFLHLSVQRIVITILESDNTRSETQKYLLCECDLLKSLMSKICEYSTAPSAPPSKVASSASLKDQNAEGEDERGNGDSNGSSSDVSSKGNSASASIMPKHSSVMGHLVLIAQALSVGLDAEGGAEIHERGVGVDATEDGGVLELSNAEEGTNAAGASSFLTDSSEGSDDAGAFSNKLNGMGLGAVDKPGSLRILLRGRGESEVLLLEWDRFVQDTLHSILDHQMVGSYSALANLSALSQDDPLKLGVDMDMFHMNGGGGFQQSHLSSEMNSAGAWHRDQYGVEDDDEDDDDFMFQGPPGGGGASRAFPDENGGTDLGGFQSNFDAFSQRQDFTASGFDLSTGEVVAASFADFASFDDEFHGSASPDSYSQPANFDDFANFAEFDSSGSTEKGDDESAANVRTGEVDFAPSEF